MSPAQIRERESRWAPAAAGASLLAVVLMVGSAFVSEVSGTGDAEVLRSVHENAGSVTASGLMQALAFALLAIPLAYLFFADLARSDRVRSQMLALMVVGPLLLGLSSGLSIGARQEAADKFVAGEARPSLTAKEAREDCAAEREDESAEDFAEEYEPAAGEPPLAACERRKLADDEASEALSEASLGSIVAILALVGGVTFAFALFYACLWAMRLGLLPRFWGSLGMALGIAALIGLVLFTLAWFLYFGLLVLGRVPGGRPPAWEQGEAIPWPTPGEKAAAELEPGEKAAAELGPEEKPPPN
jgi:hypothetical protein